MATHASRNTTTGMVFENYVHMKATGVDVSKHALYKYLEAHGIDWKKLVSRKLLPDEAYWNEETKELRVYEKKYQQSEGSADEKPQTCGFKIWEFNKIGAALGASSVTYTYILSDWFKADKYRDMLEYIKSVPNCDYIFEEEASYAG